MLGRNTSYSSYWVTVEPQMVEGMTKGYEREFNDKDDAFDKYEEFCEEYDDVKLIEENHVVTYKTIMS